MEKASEQRDVDTSCASRGVWLVKVGIDNHNDREMHQNNHDFIE